MHPEGSYILAPPFARNGARGNFSPYTFCCPFPHILLFCETAMVTMLIILPCNTQLLNGPAALSAASLLQPQHDKHPKLLFPLCLPPRSSHPPILLFSTPLLFPHTIFTALMLHYILAPLLSLCLLHHSLSCCHLVCPFCSVQSCCRLLGGKNRKCSAVYGNSPKPEPSLLPLLDQCVLREKRMNERAYACIMLDVVSLSKPLLRFECAVRGCMCSNKPPLPLSHNVR